MAKKSRDKGARGERAVVSVLKKCFPDTRRGRQYDSAREGDIEGTPFRLEVKLRKAMTWGVLEGALEQVENDGVQHEDGRVPLVIAKRDNGPFIFVGKLDNLVRIVETMFYFPSDDEIDECLALFGEDMHEDNRNR